MIGVGQSTKYSGSANVVVIWRFPTKTEYAWTPLAIEGQCTGDGLVPTGRDLRRPGYAQNRVRWLRDL